MLIGFLNRYKQTFKVFNILITCLLVAACTSRSQQAPVSGRYPPPSIKINRHVVTQGDTLFSIAWTYGLDYKTLASHNGVSGHYRIYPGQVLRLDTDNVKRAAPSTAKASSSPRTSTVNQTTVRSKKNTISPPAQPSKAVYSQRFTWRWPAKGKLLARFSMTKNVNKGIDISGKLGESVLSAASGVVVYSGSGLRGYGNLLIIKHNEKYLSAYAHNRQLLVKEGDAIKGGQKIAEIGSSGADRNKLHFEIRYNGKPVDPLKYLPRRS